MSDIAAKAEVAVGTLYNIFKNKGDLYHALVMEHAVEIASLFSEVFERDADPLDCLRAYIRIKGDVFRDNDKILRLFFNEMSGGRLHVRAALPDPTRSMYDALLGTLAEKFESAFDAGYLDPNLDPLELAVALDSITNSFIFLWMDHPEKHPYSSKVDRIELMFFGSIVTDSGRRRLMEPSENS